MSRKCVIAGKGPQTGNTVSHANNKCRTTWKVNMKSKRIFDSTTGKWVRLRVSTRALRTINRKGLSKALKEIFA